MKWEQQIEDVATDTAGVDDLDLLPIRDLALGTDFDLEVPLRVIKGAEALAQRLRIRLYRWRGDNFLNLRDGVPWRQRILGRRGGEIVARTLLRRVILETPGVSEILKFTSTLDRADRSLRVAFTVRTKGGPNIAIKAGFNA
jgi:hypothetical protein